MGGSDALAGCPANGDGAYRLLGLRQQLQAALADADIRVLLMVLVHATGDRRWLANPYRPRRDVRLIADPSAGLPPEVQAEIRSAAFEVLTRPAQDAAIDRPDESLLTEMMSVCLGEEVPAEYAPMMLQEMGFVPEFEIGERREPGGRLTAVVIGAGVSGIAAAIGLLAAGIEVRVLEKNDDIGGTWLENTYPDCGVDTPNHFYSFSFAMNPDWDHYFAPRDEILSYLRRCVDEYAVRDTVTFGATVTRTIWDDEVQVWHVTYLVDGQEITIEAPFLISAVGQLNRPSVPDLPGFDRFAGPTFHSARWRHDVDLRGRSVGVIGTGASAMQFVPRIAQEAGQLTIFQRSPCWARPIDEYRAMIPDGTKWLLQHVPAYARWMRFTLAWRYGDGLHRYLQKDPSWPYPDRSLNRGNDRHRAELAEYIRRELAGDEELIEKCLPTYPPYAKRMLIDNGWFRTLRRANVSLVTSGIHEIAAHGVVDGEGNEHPADVLVLATGFQAAHILGHIEVRGRDGVSLSERWGVDDPRAYLGICVPDFPNFFLLYGPNTNLGHGGSIFFHAECQVRYLLSAVAQMAEAGLGAVAVRAEVHDAYNVAVDEAHQNMIWTHPGVSSWYRNEAGRVVSNSPWRLVDYWHLTREARLTDFECSPIVGDAAQPLEAVRDA